MGANEMGANEMGAKQTYAEKVKTKKTCEYNNICNKAKICGDCGLDEFEREQAERFERKCWLKNQGYF
jgi:hypothetical protein